MATTPTITDYKTPYRLVLTQDLAGSSAPVEGVLRTRVIRQPGKAYWLAAKGTATGGAGIRVRGFNKTTGSWTLITTFTTFSGVLTNVISTANTTYDTVELDVYMPLGSTLTLYGMALSTYNYAIPGDILDTNYAPNPRGSGGLTTYWATVPGTGGTASLVAYDNRYPYRRNYAANPQGTSATYFGSYITGTGETGTTSYLTGQSDGPLPQITNYARWSVTAAKTANSTGWASASGVQRNALAGVTGETATVSIYIRYTGAGSLTGRMRATAYTSAGTAVGSNDAPSSVTLVSGVWTRVDATVIATGDFVSVGWWFYHLTAQIPAAGSTLDVTGVLIEKNVTAPGNYFDASFPASGDYDYLWEGTTNASISQERLPALGPDGRYGFIQYRQTGTGTGGSVGGYMRDTTGDNSGVAGDARYVYAWVRVNTTRQVRLSGSFKDGASLDVGPAVATPFTTLQPGSWYKFETGRMVATGAFSRFQVWPNFIASPGVPVTPEFTIDMVIMITDKPRDNYFDGSMPNTDTKFYYWSGAPTVTKSYETNHASYDFMPVGTGVGPVQLTSALGGTLVSAVIDRIGLTLDMTEVQNVESRMM